ncbi:MAG: hypothetical protein ACKV2Q_20440 [Planctomycetaceae bacterium]
MTGETVVRSGAISAAEFNGVDDLGGSELSLDAMFDAGCATEVVAVPATEGSGVMPDHHEYRHANNTTAMLAQSA